MDHCEIPRWQLMKSTLQNVPYDAFIGKESKDDVMYIDARTPEEFKAYHLPGAVNINYLSEHLADDLEELDPLKHYYIYCKTSRRSLRICILLKNMGFKNLFHLEEGIKDYL